MNTVTEKQPPALGRHVLLTAKGKVRKPYASEETEEVVTTSAIICKVFNDNVVNLFVIRDDGTTTAALKIYRNGDKDGMDAGWEYPELPKKK